MGLLLFSACQPMPVKTSPTPAPPTLPAATETLKPTADIRLATPSETPTPQVTEPVKASIESVEVCSPLASDPLEKLASIITQPFIMPRVMEDGTYKDDAHHGVDLGYYTRPDGSLFTGTPTLAALPGVIAGIVADRPPYGNAVIIETPFEKIPASLIKIQAIHAGNSLYTLYAHLQNLQALQAGQPIACGERLAETGLTGFTGGPHLHFETRWGAAKANFSDGMAYYRADTTDAERANYQLWRMSGQFHLFDPMLLFSPNPGTPTPTP